MNDELASRYRGAQRLIALICWLGLAVAASAHDVGLSTATIHLRPGEVEATVSFAIRDMNLLADLDADHDGKVTAAEFTAGQARAEQALRDGCLVSNATDHVEPISIRSRLDEADNIETQLIFPRPQIGGEISFPVLSDLPLGHRMFVRLTGHVGETIGEQLITRDSFPIALPADASAARAAEAPRSFLGFVLLGIEHIGTGYDHLLFLFGLLLVTRNLKSSLLVITSFTIAHSITLGVATLNLVNLRPSITEPLIALSIVYVGVENLLTRGEPQRRWLLTFAFGLIHGFGFASVLRDLGVSSAGGVALPLFSFNLGVEIGQLAVAALLLPVIWKLRRNEVFLRRAVPACCVAIVAAGGFWFCQRVWGS